MLDQIEPFPGRRLMDDVKMASAVTIAAAVLIPAILAYAFIAWLFRTSSIPLLRSKPAAKVESVRSPSV